jgi:hypothetical protein
MEKRLASLFLLLVLFGGAFAGVPLSFGESNCSMGGMMDMECCKAALRLKEATTVSEEEMLCALDCAQNQTTLPAGVVRVTPPTQTIHPAQPSLTQPVSISRSYSRATQTHSPPGSPPTYLRNLTLLI